MIVSRVVPETREGVLNQKSAKQVSLSYHPSLVVELHGDWIENCN